jgi:hypothetical protein
MKNIAFFEENQLYFIGFGVIFALSSNFSFFLSAAIYAVLSPLFILTSISSTPPDINSITSFKTFIQFFKEKKCYKQISQFKYDANKKQGFSLFYLPKKLLQLTEDYFTNKYLKN